MSDQPTIRLATEEDVPYILQFIRELAEYENALDQVEATEESLLATLSFPSDSTNNTNTTTTTTTTKTQKRGSTYTALVFPPGSKVPVGMALYFYNYSTWRSAPGIYLEDLYVQPAARGKGYGLALFRYLAREVVYEIKGKRLEWSVLKWNEPSIKFYKALGAREMVEWEKMMLDGEGLVNLADGGK